MARPIAFLRWSLVCLLLAAGLPARGQEPPDGGLEPPPGALEQVAPPAPRPVPLPMPSTDDEPLAEPQAPPTAEPPSPPTPEPSSPRATEPQAPGDERPPPAPGPQPPGGPATRAVRPSVPAKKAPPPSKITMNFKDAEIEQVVKFISDLTQKNFMLDEKVRGKITVISPSQLTLEEAYEVFQAILDVKGFTIVPTGRIYKIVPSREAKQTNIETVTEDAAPGSRFVTRILRLDYLDANVAAGLLAPLVSKDGSVVPYAPTNTLIITDAFINIERLIDILRSFDVETVDIVLETIRLKNASADAVAKTLQQAVLDKPGGARPATPRAQAGGARPAPAPAAPGAENSSVRIIPDARTNSLIVIADPQTLEDIRKMVAILDESLPKGSGKINVYYLKYADAENVASVLTAISKTAGTKPKPGQAGAAAAPAQPMATARVGGDLSVEFEEPVQITADKATNSLVIIATPQDYDLLQSVIGKLDIRRPQVLVEAMIFEVSYSKTLNLGVEWRSLTNHSSDGTTVIGGSTYGGIQELMKNPTAVPMGLAIAAVQGMIDIDGNGTKDVLNVGALFQALQASDDVNVLSTPHILTTDNEEAEIVVSDNIPFKTATKYDSNGYPLETLEYKDVGLTLRLTPQINDENYVKLKLFQEISQLVSTSTGGNDNAPQTTKRSAKTTVVVKDASTVVIGGLIKDNNMNNASSVPCLGDLPVLGYLFKSLSDEKKKTNLLIFLTPHIIKNMDDLEAISRAKRAQFEDDARKPELGPKTVPEKLEKYLDGKQPERALSPEESK